MIIGVWLDENYKPTDGGGFSYYDKMINAIDSYGFDGSIDLNFVSLIPKENSPLRKGIVYLGIVPKFLLAIPIIGFFMRTVNRRSFRYWGDRIIRKRHIDIVLYLTQCSQYPCDKIAFVANNWDIGHCSTFPFPEISRGYETRSNFYRNILPKALMVFSESKAGKQELLRYTEIGEHKIQVLPIFSGGIVDISLSEERMNEILKNMGLYPGEYFLYPAQFWAHKNHYGLLLAYKEFLKTAGKDYKLVLCGSDKGNKEYILQVIQTLGLDRIVLVLGYVSNEELNAVYRNATALVMASFFGPTNMPPIEAMDLGIPVVCSDIPGHKEILGDSAVYFDPCDPESITKGLVEISSHRDEYAGKIVERRTVSEFNISNTMACLNKYLLKASFVRSQWKSE